MRADRRRPALVSATAAGTEFCAEIGRVDASAVVVYGGFEIEASDGDVK